MVTHHRARHSTSATLLLSSLLFPLSTVALAQTAPAPTLQVGPLNGSVRIDGVLDEAEWAQAAASDAFTQTEPAEGSSPTLPTIVRVLAGPKALVIGVSCDDTDPSGIVSFSVRRDAPLVSEDHVRIVLGPFLDGRSGYVFAVNPSGARYDGLINPGGESDNPDWDGIWEASTSRTATGWAAEIRIPIQTLSFNPSLREWHFNIQRRIQRRLETDRWAFPARQYQVTQTSRAGLLTGLPQFDLGRQIAQPTLGAQHEHRQPLDGVGQQVGAAGQPDLVVGHRPQHEAGQQPALGRAIAGGGGASDGQVLNVLRELCVQETARVGALGADQAPVGQAKGAVERAGRGRGGGHAVIIISALCGRGPRD